MIKRYYRTDLGEAYQGDSLEALARSKKLHKFKGQIDLIFTSPPFPLVKKKSYGNKVGQNYIDWIGELGKILKDYLSPTGSIAIQIGKCV